MNTPSHFSAKQNPSQATMINGSNNQTNEDELEVELASAGQRISAALMNILIFGIVVSPITYGLFTATDQFGGLFWGACISIPLLLILTIWQLLWMSTRGQSIGKRIMKIKVIGENGENPNFWRVVLLREVAFYFISAFIMTLIITGVFLILANPLRAMPFMGVFIFFKILPICLPYLTCLVMLCTPQNHECRTLQDYLAKTVVIKV